MAEEYIGLNILVIEDNQGDFLLIEDYLGDELDDVSIHWSKTLKETTDALNSSHTFDVILLDLSLPDSPSSEVLVDKVVYMSDRVPVIVLTGNINKRFGLKTLSQGISDYLQKDELTSRSLCKSIEYSIERNKIQSQLAESEKKYRTLFESSPLPMWVLDLHSLEFLSINKAAVDLYGFSREEFLQMNVRDLWAGGISERVEKIVKENFYDYFEVKVTHRKKNGELMYVDIQSNPIIFAGKEARVTLAADVTSQVRTKQELQQSEKRFKALVQDGSDLIAILDEDLNYNYVSPTSKPILGIIPDDLIGTNAFSFIHPEDRGRVTGHLELLKEKKRVQIPSFRFKNGNGEWRWIETILTNLSDDPAIGGIVANSRDVTEFILQEQKLVESLRRYDTVSKATSDLITDYDIETDTMLFNEVIYEMLGYKTAEVENNASWWNSIIHPEDRDRVKYSADELHNKGVQKVQLEYRVRCSDGDYKYVLDRSYLLNDENGKPKRIIASIQDITERNNYIQAIESHNERLQEIAWIQSHEVRAPLARIMGLADLIKNHMKKTENIDQLLENMLTSAEELDLIIRRIASKTEDKI